MEIRLATHNDIEPVCKLYNEFFAHNANLQSKYYRAATETGGYPKSTIENENSDIFIAAESDTIIGFIHIREAQAPPFDALVPHRYAEIIDFIVTADCRKKGIGGMLLSAAKQWAKSRNLDYIELFVLCEATDEIHFYEQKDFVTVSQTMRYPLW